MDTLLNDMRKKNKPQELRVSEVRRWKSSFMIAIDGLATKNTELMRMSCV